MKKGYVEIEEVRLSDSENVKGLIKFWERRLKYSNLPINPVTSAFIQATLGVLRSLPDQPDENNTSLLPKEKYDHITRLVRQDI